MKRDTKKNGRSHKPKPKLRPKKAGFWREKTVEELAAEQGVEIPQRIEDLLGAGENLWKDDAELDAFLEFIRQQRKAGK
jgi:hypothetical protein